MTCFLSFSCAFSKKRSPIGGMSSFIQTGVEYSFKRENTLLGEYSFRGKALLIASYMLLMSSFSVFDSKGGEF